MIRVFPSPFSNPELHDPIWSGPNLPGETVLEVVQRLVPSYDPHKPVPWQCKVGGLPLEPSRYERAVLTAETPVDFYLTPRGDVINDVLNIFTLGAWNLVMKFLTPKVSGVNSGSGQQRDRDDMDQAAAKANTVKQGAVIREKFGQGRIYPDHLTQIRRRFVDGEPRRQFADMALSLGRGRFQVDLGKSKVGETTQAALGDNIVVRLHEPGADVAGDNFFDNWYTSSEVGGTSGGSAGLELTVISPITLNADAASYVLAGSSANIPTGAGEWPTGWAAGMVVRAVTPYDWTVVDGGAGLRDKVRGPLSMLAPAPGMELEVVRGAVSEFYKVNTYTPYSPAVPPSAGTPSTLLGSAAPARYNFNVTPLTFQIGGGSILNRVIDTYSWLGSALPTVNKSADINVSSLALAASASGYAYRCDTTTTTTSGYVRLNPTSGAGASYLEPGTYRVSVYASSAAAGATLQCGVFDGTTNVTGAAQAITTTRARYVFTITIATAMNASFVAYVNRAGLAGNTLLLDSPMIERTTGTAAPFERGSRILTLNTAVGDLIGLVSAINALKGSAPFTASASGGALLLTQTGTNNGLAIFSAGATDILGSAPVSTPGTAETAGTPEQPAEMTLNYEDGSPVTALPIGTFALTIGFKGLRYRILTADPQTITLERLTDTGATDGTWPGFDTLTTASAQFSLDQNTAEADWTGPYAACPEGELTDRLEFDFFYPAGLYKSDGGNPVEYSVTVEIEWRDITTAGAWTAQQFTHTSDLIAQVGYSHEVLLPGFIRPEARARRVTIDSTEGTISDQVQWYGLKSRLQTRPNSYPGLSTVGVRVFGGGALAAQAEQMVSFWCTRILPRRSGGNWIAEGPTRSIRDAALYLAKDRGYTDARLDLAEWDRLDAIWDARGDYFDGSFEKETTAEEALNVICRPGYAQVIAPRGVLRPVRDAQRSEAEKAVARLYGVGNSTDIKRSGQPITPNDTDGVDVKYVDPTTWTTETVKCRLPGVPSPNKVTQITLEGVNDRTRAWRLGMRELMIARYRRWKHTWSCDMSALASAYMDYCEVQDTVPELASAGQAEYWDGALTFTSNEPIPADATIVALRKPDGTKFGPVGFTRIDDYSFTLTSPLDFTPVTEMDGGRVPTHIFFGTVSEMFWPVLMSSVSPSGQFRANVEALGYDERVYQYDDEEPPEDA